MFLLCNSLDIISKKYTVIVQFVVMLEICILLTLSANPHNFCITILIVSPSDPFPVIRVCVI